MTTTPAYPTNPKIMLCKGDLPKGIKFAKNQMAVDTETLGLNPHRDRLCVCQVADGHGNVWLVQFDGKNYKAPNLKAYLSDNKLQKLFHFGRFDIAVLEHYLGCTVDNVYCTKIVSKLTRTYTDRHGLGALCQELLGVTLDKQQQTSHWAATDLSDAQQLYAANDVLYLHALKEAFASRLADAARTQHAEKCFAFLPTRARLDLAGWPEEDIFAHS